MGLHPRGSVCHAEVSTKMRKATSERPGMTPGVYFGFVESLEGRFLLAAQLSVSQGATPIGDQATVSFGSAVVGQAAPTQTFTLKNTGDVPLSLAFDDTNSAFSSLFTVVNSFQASLAPNATTTLGIALNTS